MILAFFCSILFRNNLSYVIIVINNEKELIKVKKRYVIAGGIALAATSAFAYYLYKENKTIESQRYHYTSSKVPKAFDGTKILLISDLHNNLFQKEQTLLLDKIKLHEPDYIFICGDLVHAEKTNMDNMQPIKYLIEAIEGIYPCFFVAGNHEARNADFLKLCDYLSEHDVMVLNDEIITLESDGECMDIVGCLDPRFHGNHKAIFKRNLQSLYDQCDSDFKLLLSHRPEYFETYASIGFDLVFAGHAHGGGIQYQKQKGLYAPNQGLFPKYCDGKYQKAFTTMFVSRGLGNASCPVRIQARPHLLSVELHHE